MAVVVSCSVARSVSAVARGFLRGVLNLGSGTGLLVLASGAGGLTPMRSSVAPVTQVTRVQIPALTNFSGHTDFRAHSGLCARHFPDLPG
eukprot:jgi/Chrzof1/13196/Cz07g24020.t1